MSAGAATSVRDRAAAPAKALTFPRVLRAEWLKLQTLRSTWVTLAAAIVVLTLAAGLIGHHLHDNFVNRTFEDPNDRDVLTTPLRGFGVTQLVMGVLGVLSITGEYATGMIRSTLTAVPTRLPVLWAKVLVFAVLGFASMLVATFSAFFVGEHVLAPYGVGLGAPHALRVVIALAGYLTLVGLLGMGIGFMVRSTAGGIASLVGLLLVAPGILAALSTSWATTASHYLPLSAGLAMFNDRPPFGGQLSPSGGLTVMVLWVVASIVGAAVVLTRRDA